ncbi:LamG-like jellyroll fold domain-containing protein [Lachnospiraceae bacterium 46-15]
MRRKFKRAVPWILAVCLGISGVMPHAGEIQAKAAASLEDGLAGYWNFDGDTDEERLQNRASGSNIAAEKSGSGVTLKSGDGISGGSVYFSKTANSYIKLNLKAADRGLNASTDDFTFSAWVKYDSDVLNGDKINLFQQTADVSNTGADGRTVLYLNTGRKYGTYLTGADAVCDGSTIEVNNWHHVAVTYEHTQKKMQFYVNGSLAGESTLSGTAVNTDTDILVGIHKNMNAVGAVKGYVDELRYYNKVVNADTVKAIYDEFGLAEGLRALIEEAESLNESGSASAEAAANMQTAINAAKELLSGGTASKEQLEEKMLQLQAAIEVYQRAAVVTIAVDTTDVVREIPSAMFGINHRYHKDGYGSWDTSTHSIVDAFNVLSKEANFGSVRYPGGTVSNLFTWKDTIGPLEERMPTIAGNNFYSTPGEVPVAPAFGVDEAMKWIYDDLGSEAIFVYGLGRGNPQDAADLVEYLNAPNDGSNPGGGVDWAAIRAQNGHEEPYGVVRFEMGNEFSDVGQDYWMAGKGSLSAVDAYIDGGVMTYTAGQTSYYQNTTNVAKKADWRAAASNSDGNPNEERYVYWVPVVEDSAAVSVAGTAWRIVDSLEGQGAENVCTFDYETGKITFGDGTNGNIPAAGAKITCTYQSRQAGFVDYYDAMKAVADEIGTDIEIYSGIVDRLQKEFITKMNQKGYNDKYDGVIIHPYTSFSSAAQYEDSLATAKQKTDYVASHKDAMMNATGDDSKKVAISEFGINTSSNYVTSLGTAIYIANHMVDGVNAGAAYQNKHCLVDFTVGDNLGAWQQCVIQCHNSADEYKYVATPSLHLFSIFNNMTGNVQVNQEISGNGDYCGSGNSIVKNVNVYSTRDEKGNTYVLCINNKKSDASSVRISVDDRDLTGEEITVWDLSSENVDDMNTLAEPDKVTVRKTSVMGNGTALDYTLPAHSVTGFKIPREKVAVTALPSEGGSVSGSISKAEIGSEVTVTAEPEKDYEFAGWYKGETKVSEDAVYTFIVTEAVELMAKFKKKTAPIVPEPDNPTPDNPKPDNPKPDNPTPDNPKPPVPDNPKPSVPEKGTSISSGAADYKVTKSGEKGGTVTVSKVAKGKTIKSLNIPDTIKWEGYTLMVTEVAAKAFRNNKKITSVNIGTNVTKIGAQAFFKCSKLKKIIFKGKKAPKISSKAFKGIAKNCKVYVTKKMPKKQVKLLQARLKKAGVKSSVKYKK